MTATSTCHSVDHLITHGNVDQAGHATTGRSTSVRTPAFLQLIYGVGPSSADTLYDWLRHDDDDDDDDDDVRQSLWGAGRQQMVLRFFSRTHLSTAAKSAIVLPFAVDKDVR